MLSSSEIKVKLKELSQRLGFDGFGVCSAADFPAEQSARLKLWLDGGFADKMGYMGASYEKRISPKKFFPKAVSAVCVCASFYRPSPENRVALYAQSEDYHGVIRPKLLEMASLLESFGGEQRVSVDSSGLWEKPLAARAGLGWIGKNTLLTREKYGAWSFIGVVLTSLELPQDAPLENKCGSCDACVRACPNGAISDIGVDARLCISNLTIERKGALSEEEKRLARGMIFGCDICLRACPFGKFAPPPEIAQFRSVLTLPENPSDEEIELAARGTPISRRYGKNI